MPLTLLGLTAAACIYVLLQGRRRSNNARHTAVIAFMIALGQPTLSALVAAFAVWCLKVLDKQHENKSRARLVVEGLVGAGKSTLVTKLGGRCEALDAWEPFLEWETQKNPGRMFCRQVRFIADYVTDKAWPRVEERSWASSLMFTNLLLSDHDARFMQSYLSIVRSVVRSRAVVVPSVVVYLNKSPEECLGRIKARNGPGDKTVTLAYLKRLEAAHEALMNFYRHLGVEVIDTKDMTDDDVEQLCRDNLEISVDGTYDPEDVIKAMDLWFGA